MKTFIALLLLSLLPSFVPISLANSNLSLAQSKPEQVSKVHTFKAVAPPQIDAITGKERPLTQTELEGVIQILEKRIARAELNNSKVSLKGNTISIHSTTLTGAEREILRELITTQSLLAVHKLHPRSIYLTEEAKLVFQGKMQISGYKAYPQFQAFNNKLEYYLVTAEPALTGADIKHAWPNKYEDTLIDIELSDEGGEKMRRFTRPLIPGESSVAVIVDGRIINRAVIQAEELGKMFVISGLDGAEECKMLSNLLVNPMPFRLQIVK